ncbi:restriction endonuclease subunit S [Pectobacterium jejuense]|uniref:restriction endonuclease subunit S n=1 Tax=Pectobacterium jejuense TaxID=2974022 RepID=UPI002280955F|nr:restriction endonuclease subunit S [Pectobacterium jejuense]MCY9849284.1 restriction endonuclease subunit S [Pectobacterium jejuense]
MTGRYKAYPEYKASDIDWVGDIPASWTVKPTFSVFNPSVTKNTEGEESTVLSLSYGNIVERDVDTNFGLLPESFNTYQIVDNGDLILRLTDLQNDKKSLRVGLVKQRGIITSAYLKLRASNSIEARFAYRLLHSYDTTKVFYGMGGGLRQSMKFEDFRRLPILIPPFEEQQKIANFLDHETAKIDTLISRQEKLIELLKEKRQAVISHAVTKGLNPNAPMKDSGVEWLGDVPEHWGVVKCGYLGQLFGSESISEDLISDNGNIPFVKVSTLSLDSFDLTEKNFFVDCSKVSMSKAKSNYVVFPKRGAAIFTNKVNIVKEKSFIDPNLMGWELGVRVLPEYVAYMLKLRGLGDIADVSTVPQINNKHIDPMKFPLPPITEQKEVLESLSAQVANLNLLVQKASEAIALMRERKTALISAAVTGKIDVRDWELK